MAEIRDIRLGLMTVFGPKYWLQMQSDDQLLQLPHITRNREEIEKEKEDLMMRLGLVWRYDEFHGRLIINIGEHDDTYRNTWIEAGQLLPCLSDLEPRLIYTFELGEAPSFRVEFRNDWLGEPTTLPADLREIMLTKMRKHWHLSVRQLWINPVVPEASPQTRLYPIANLMIGALFKKKREPLPAHADILQLRKQNEQWWLRYKWNGS
jgi:hypothetical protein